MILRSRLAGVLTCFCFCTITKSLLLHRRLNIVFDSSLFLINLVGVRRLCNRISLSIPSSFFVSCLTAFTILKVLLHQRIARLCCAPGLVSLVLSSSKFGICFTPCCHTSRLSILCCFCFVFGTLCLRNGRTLFDILSVSGIGSTTSLTTTAATITVAATAATRVVFCFAIPINFIISTTKIRHFTRLSSSFNIRTKLRLLFLRKTACCFFFWFCFCLWFCFLCFWIVLYIRCLCVISLIFPWFIFGISLTTLFSFSINLSRSQFRFIFILTQGIYRLFITMSLSLFPLSTVDFSTLPFKLTKNSSSRTICPIIFGISFFMSTSFILLH